MQAIYISSNQFKVSTDKTEEFLTGRRVRANCGGTYSYSTIQSSTYSDPDTTITIEESILTSDLSEVHYGIINIGEQGSFPKHSHDGNEGTGGVLSLLNLEDTPSVYNNGKYLRSTTSGVEFTDLNDYYYTESEIDTISGSLQTNIDGKSDTSHLHDNRYYTETELNNGQLDDWYYTESEIDTISGSLQTNIDGKPDTEIFLTEGVPSNSVGKAGDIAVNQEVGTIYKMMIEYGFNTTTWNPSDKSADITLSNNDLTAFSETGSGYRGVRSVFGVSSGKWYWEITCDQNSTGGSLFQLGVGTSATILNNDLCSDVNAYIYTGVFGKGCGGGGYVAYGTGYTAGDVIGIALDMDNGKIWFSKNGSWEASGDPTAGTNPTCAGLSGIFFAIWGDWGTGGKVTANFGASAFSHSVPSGFVTGLGEISGGWEEKLSPDFLKLSDTPTTYSGASGKYVKTTYSGIEFSDDYHFGDATNYTQIETDGKIHFFGDAQPVNFIIMDSLTCDASHLAPLGLTSLAAADGILTSGLDTATGSSRRIEVVGVDGGIYVKGRDKGSYTQGDTTHSSHRIKIKLNTTNAVWEQSGEWKVILDILSGDITGDFTVYMPPFSIMEYDSLEGYITVDGATYAEITPRGFDVSLAGSSAAEELFSSNETTGSGIVVEVASTAGFYVGNEVFVSDSSNSEWTRIKEIVEDTSITADLTNSYTTANGAKFNTFDYIKTTLTEPIQRGLFRAKVFKANENSGVQLQMPVPQQTDSTKDLGVVLQYVSTVDNPGSSLVSKWRVQYFFKTLGEDIPESYQYAELIYVDVTPPVTKCNYIATLATLTQADHQGKNLLAMEVARLGEDSGDTYTGDFKLVAIITTMPWKQLGYEA